MQGPVSALLILHSWLQRTSAPLNQMMQTASVPPAGAICQQGRHVSPPPTQALASMLPMAAGCVRGMDVLLMTTAAQGLSPQVKLHSSGQATGAHLSTISSMALLLSAEGTWQWVQGRQQLATAIAGLQQWAVHSSR
jgi:hypothetical protein